MRRALLLAIGIIVTACIISGCGGERRLTPEEAALVKELEDELVVLETEILLSEIEADVYSGGLVRALLESRIEVTKLTKALVEQRVQAIESGAKVNVVVNATSPDTARARALEHAIESLEAELEVARAEASIYAGGLLYSMKLSSVAMQEQTLAMLRQAQLAAKYGLALPVVLPADIDEEPDLAGGIDALAETAPEVPTSPAFEIVSVDGRVTEANDSWSRFAWRLTVRNLSERSVSFDATIEFLDADGFVVDDDREYGLGLAAGEERTFTGHTLITAAAARNVEQVGGKVRQKRW